MKNLIDNDDETFKRTVPRRKVFPHTMGDEEDEIEDQKFIFSLIEK